ncbi:MAG: tRNA pseudouridine(38-40) synthase TruA [Clostridiales bacterium]|nr:tRNA pseudouridine(38-40) synthase TruA [Clostridiales bacterium]
MERNILLTIEYDGTNFCGWQKQPGRRSVQGEIERALGTVCGREVKLNGASRTDAGVHAYGQRASFEGGFGIPTCRIAVAANNILSGGKNSLGAAGDVRITAAEEKPLGFHARFDAKAKKYVYKIRNESEADIFKRNYAYQVVKPLNIGAMEDAAKLIVGTKDFKCFQAAGGDEKRTTVRTVYSLGITGVRDVQIEIVGDAFLYNMVRIIAGTLVEAGLGKIRPSAIASIIASVDRQNAGHTAPPQGLYLAEVYYDDLETGGFYGQAGLG